MRLKDLDILQNITPRWGAGHYLARHQSGELLEVLVAEQTSESVTSLLAWANAFERITHPCLPQVQTIVHHEASTFVALKVQEGLSLAQCVQNNRASLNKLDILSLFFQLATALKKLHEHGLNHGNLNLDNMLLIGEGGLLLQGWAPPTLETTFALRLVDELKRFKSFFYLTLVGQFPPKNRSQTKAELDRQNPIETQRLNAWTSWYHSEREEPKPNLSSARLMLFDEAPQSADELIDEIAPYVNRAFKSFYQQLDEAAAQREDFDQLYLQREQLLSELERLRLTAQLWLRQHAESIAISESHHQKLEQFLENALRLQRQLSSLSGISLDASEVTDQSDYRVNRGSHTAFYEPGNGSEAGADELDQSFGYGMKLLDEQWATVRPDAPIYLDSMDHPEMHPLLFRQLSSESASASPAHLFQSGSWAELPPILPSGNARASTLEARPRHTEDIQALTGSNYSELAIAPLPSPEEIVSRSGLHAELKDQQSTQFFERLRDRYTPQEIGNESLPSDQALSALGMSALLPGHTQTVFTQHYQQLESELHTPEEQAGLQLAFSHKNFFFFLYLTAATIFIWSLIGGQDQTLPRATPPTSAQGVDTQDHAQHQSSFEQDQPSSSPELEIPQEDAEVPPSDLSEENTPQDPPPPPPPGMVYIPGGIVHEDLSEKAYQQLLTINCAFTPSYDGGRKLSRETCKRLIPQSESTRTFEVAPFFMDRFEVSKRDYVKYCADGGVCDSRPHFPKDELDHPMVNLRMIQAIDYCNRFGKNLPSYEQWLFAARGEEDFAFPWGNSSILEARKYRANYKSDRQRRGRSNLKELDGHIGPHDVKWQPELGQSPFGVAHMAGNVREWVSRDRRKLGWVTGGSWDTPLWELRIGAGEYLHEFQDRRRDVGFRCVSALTPTPASP